MNDYDVIVVGSGGAGHCAAISAAEHGARVLVLEAADRVGGTTASGRVIYAAGTSMQKFAGIDDAADKMFEHYVTFNQWGLDPSIVRRYCDESGPTIEWLIGLGVEYSPEELYLDGVELGTRRGHMPDGFGYQYIQTLSNRASSQGVEFVCNTVCSSAGLEVDANGRVEDESDQPIPGHYAIGEAAGGIVGKYLGGGNSVGSGAIFGRIAGKAAALEAKGVVSSRGGHPLAIKPRNRGLGWI